MTSVYPHWVSDNSPIPDPLGHGERAVQFLRNLTHPKSTLQGRAFQLDRWQERIVRRIYGPVDADGQRQVRTVFALIPRGNRKTALGAGLACLHTFGPERIPHGQVVSAAADQKQAAIAFDEALGIVRATKGVAGRLKLLPSTYRIQYPTAGATYEAVSSDGATQHGRTPNFVLSDELHSWKKRDLWDALKTGLSKSAGSLHIVTTTAGRGRENLAADMLEYARQVASGTFDDPSFLPILFETPADADWRDESVWHTANPGLAFGYPDLKALRAEAREAEGRPSEREAFRQYHLNVWLDHSASPFVEMAVYDAGNAHVDLSALKGRPCWLGVDLSSNADLTVIVAAWHDGDDGYVVRPWFFCPADNLRARAERDGVPYPRWTTEGLITPTAGNVVDFRAVEDKVRALCAEFDVREIAFDPHLARNSLNNLSEDGYPAVEFRQGWQTMAPAVKELERAIVGGRFRHGGHPILRWHFENIAVETDKSGNMQFHKGKSRDRIDGAVATAMAIARAAAGEDGGSYATRPWANGITFLGPTASLF